MNKTKIVAFDTPTRALDFGGWSDVMEYVPKGNVTNITINSRSLVILVRKPRAKDDRKIRIMSINFGTMEETAIGEIQNGEYKGTYQLLQAAIKRMGIDYGLEVTVSADAPPACGVGTSAAISVALLGALHRLENRKIDPLKIAIMAQKLETEELGLSCGLQDQMAASFGGCNFMEFQAPDQVKITKIKPNKDFLIKLRKHLFLVYFGSRSSSAQHRSVFPRLKSGDQKVAKAIDDLRKCGLSMKEIWKLPSIEKIAQVMNESWVAAKRLSEQSNGQGITTPQIEKVYQLVFENGAIGFDVNGAAGGGSAMILADKGQESNLKKALKNNAHRLKIKILPYDFDFEGLREIKINKKG